MNAEVFLYRQSAPGGRAGDRQTCRRPRHQNHRSGARAARGLNPADLRKYFVTEPDGTMGHKSSFGNLDVAKRVAAAVGDLAPPSGQKSK